MANVNKNTQNNGNAAVIPPNPSAPAPLVEQMARQNFAMRNGGMDPASMQGAPNSSIPPVATVAQPMDFFGQGGGIQGRFDQKPSTAVPAPENGTQGVQITNPSSPQQNDLASLSQALSNAGVSQPQQNQFQSDPTQRDGGFFNWLGSIIPKNRPGLRQGETPDEYDARVTRNRQMYFTLADAIRHMGNIINTTKYAPVQQFNDPSTMIEQGRQNRKAQRQKQAALDADMAQKAAEMDIKERAAQAADAYRKMQFQLGLDKFKYQQGKDAKDFDYKQRRDAISDAQKDRTFNANQQQRAASNALRAASIAKRGSGGGRSGKGGSGSGGKYWFEDKNGKMRYQPNKTMWEQEYYREYGSLPKGETNTSTSTKSIDYNTGQERTTTTRKKGASMTSQAAQQQNAAQKARKNQGARKGSKLKNVSALGL